MPKPYLYRAHIIEYPEFEDYIARDWSDRYQGHTKEMWCRRPVGWQPDSEYLEHYETDQYFEPATDRWNRSRSSAKRRVDLLNSMGYKAIVQRSAPVVWPAGDKDRVDGSEVGEVLHAIGVLKRAGVDVDLEEVA